jgi:FdhD protein
MQVLPPSEKAHLHVGDAAGEIIPLAIRALRLLVELDQQATQPGSGVALTRLAKRLQTPLSALLRELTLVGSASMGGHAGPGWVRVQADADGRWLAWATDAGRAAAVGASASRVRAQTWRSAGERWQVDVERDECVAEEQPVALEYNGISHAVMLATPADLEDFALGFSITEGLIEEPGDLLDIEPDETDEGLVLRLRISARCEMQLKQRRRFMAGRTGCGLCGADSLDQVRRTDIARVQPRALRPESVERAMDELAQAQVLQALTGGVHAAAWCDADGALQLLREDVGRHNALDKLVGAMRRLRIDPRAGFIAVTSRASFEMVQKAAVAGAGLLVCVSAPTGLAVRMAADVGLTLAGFARKGRVTLFTPGDSYPSAQGPFG